MKIVMISIWLLVEMFCLLLFLWDVKRREKYLVANSNEEERCIDINIKGKKYTQNEVIVTAVFSVLAAACGYCVCARIASVIDILKVLIGFVGLSATAIIDYRVKLIPNYLVVAILGSRVIMMLPEFFLEREEFSDLVISSLVSAVLVFVVLFILSVASKGGIGMGDVKILMSIGFLCGIYMVINTMLMALLVCVLVAMGLIMKKKKKIKDKIPFGPFLFVGYIITLVLGAY